MVQNKIILSSRHHSQLHIISRLLICGALAIFCLTGCCPCSQEETTEEAVPFSEKITTKSTTEADSTKSDTISSGKAKYVGASSCKTCHAKQYTQWEQTKHSNAFSKIKSHETEGKCLKCHTTGYKENGGFTTLAQTPKMVNVQCEDCHGPGREYKTRSIMKDKAKAIKTGLIMPTEAVCKKCHNTESPNFKPFDFKERYKLIKHKL